MPQNVNIKALVRDAAEAVLTDVPHFAGKRVIEQVIDDQAIPATVLRPAYLFQNDMMFKNALHDGTYPQPIGSVGLAMVDARDIADAAVSELLRRERPPLPLPHITLDVVGPETLTGKDVASIWTKIIGREVRYVGDDLQRFETDAAGKMPGWRAHDLELMLRAFQSHGMVPGADARKVLEGVVGHSLQTYRAFAQEASVGW